jgi:hypothetical protein
MLKNIVVLISAFAVFIVVFGWAENQIAPSFQSCIGEQSGQKAAQSSENNGSVIARLIKAQAVCSLQLIDRHNGFFAALAAVAAFTFTLWWATDKQGELTRESIDLAREEFNATHRPKITIHSMEFRRVPHEGEDDWDRIGAVILCFNIGEAPAKNVEARGEILPIADLPINVQRRLVKPFAVVASGEKFIFEINSDWLVRELIQREQQGFPSFKCVGTIVYFDGNGTRRETAFCRQLDISASGERWISAGSPQHEYEY